ncbi:acyltransferase family protein, partial [Sphingomonas sp. SRS2]|uniref:acyltransferase family protein n=1 Tax=Sphingomonas sp. SRS2 TaxID=133190 RepID=UPI00061846F6
MTEQTKGALPGVARRPFLPPIHLLRGLAISMVVCAHCWPSMPWTPGELKMFPIFFRHITTTLVFVSGFLFQYTGLRYSYRQCTTTNLKRLIIPYILYSIPIMLIIFFVKRRADVWPWLYELPDYQQIIAFLITGKHMVHFWYIPVAMLLVILSFAFKLIDRYNLYYIFLPLSTAVALILGRDSLYGLYAPIGKLIFV